MTQDVPYPVEQIVEKIVERTVPQPYQVQVPVPYQVTQPYTVEKIIDRFCVRGVLWQAPPVLATLFLVRWRLKKAKSKVSQLTRLLTKGFPRCGFCSLGPQYSQRPSKRIHPLLFVLVGRTVPQTVTRVVERCVQVPYDVPQPYEEIVTVTQEVVRTVEVPVPVEQIVEQVPTPSPPPPHPSQ